MSEWRCDTTFQAPDYPGGPDEAHFCQVTREHSFHECICGAQGKRAGHYGPRLGER